MKLKTLIMLFQSHFSCDKFDEKLLEEEKVVLVHSLKGIAQGGGEGI